MALILEVKVVPSSGRLSCQIDQPETLKCFVKSSPEGGKANAELIKFLSKRLKIPQKQITIITGATSRKKRVKISHDISFQQLCNILEL